MSNPYRDKLLSVGYLSRGRTRAKVREGRRGDGTRVKATTDELGNTTTEHATRDDRVDVTVRPQTVRATRDSSGRLENIE
jgi:hypothetical protein